MNKVHTATAVVAALFLASCVFGHTVALRMLLLGTGLILASVVGFRDRREIRLLPPIWLPFLLWGGWALLSLAWSIEPERTEKEWSNEVFYTGAAIWVCYVAAQAPRALRIFVALLAAAGALAAVLSIHAFFRGPEAYANGWHGGPGDHSSALLCLMAGALVLAWHAARLRAPLYARAAPCLLILLFLASAYATLNRTIWLGFAAQVMVMGAGALWWLGRDGQPPVRRGLKLAAVAGAAAVLAAATLITLHVNATKEGGAVAAAEPKRDSRMDVWREVSQRIAERPLLGHGFGRGIEASSIREKLGGSSNLWHAHNLFLDAVLQTGVVGLGLFLLLLGKLAQGTLRLVRDADPNAAACGLALAGVLTGMVVRNMTDTLLVRQNALLFWGLTGLLLATTGAKSWRASS